MNGKNEPRIDFGIDKSDEHPQTEGIKIEATEGQIKPPLEGVTEDIPEGQPEAPTGESPQLKQAVSGKMPLHPAVVKLPLRVEGEALAQLTGFDGWRWSEEELNDLADLWVQCGIYMSPVAQAMIATVAALGAKGMAYVTWKRTARQKLSEAALEAGK